jgi:hypothetical protein
MALDNLISIEFTQTQIDQLNEHFMGIKTIIKDKMINITPDERGRYSRVSYEMIPWVLKNKGYMETNPAYIPPYVNMTEFEKDLNGRGQIDPLHKQAKEIYEMFDDSMLLLGHDLYYTCLAFYNSVKNASKSNAPGSTSIYEDLAQQFPGRPKKVK